MVSNDWLESFVTWVDQGRSARAECLPELDDSRFKKHVSLLEEHYGTPLFDAASRRNVLTPAGEIVYRFALKTLHGSVQQHDASRADSPHDGTCRLSATESIGSYLYPKLLLTQREYPRLRVFFNMGSNQNIETDLLNSRLDVGYVTRTSDSHRLQYEAVFKDTICLVLPSGMTFKRYEQLKEIGLVHHPDIEHYADLLLKKQFPDQYSDLKDFDSQGYANQYSMVLESVAMGLGFTILPASAVKAFRAKKRLRAIKFSSPVFDTIYRVYRKQLPLPARFEHIHQRLFGD